MAIRSRRAKIYPPITLAEGNAIGLDEAEWERIVERLGRNPNHFEASIFSALWSDRVSFKNSSALIEAANFEYKGLEPLAGSTLKLLNLNEDTQLALRISQYNALCNIEPFYAAQDALDSALQEMTAAGAEPLAVLTLGRFGNPEQLSHQRKFRRLVEGLSKFGNTFGIPILQSDFYFHNSYKKSPLVNAAVIGLIKTKKPARTEALPLKSPVLYVGALTGLDLPPDANNHDGTQAIPMGDPLLSSRLLRASEEAISSGAVEEVIVLGPGGLGVAAFNMSLRAQIPILLDVDRVPLRSEIKDPLAVLLSESADRVLMITSPNKHRELTKILYKWDLSATRIGEVNDSDGLEFFWNNYQVADIPFHFAVHGAQQKTMSVVQFPPMLKRTASHEDVSNVKRRKRVDQDEWSLVREANLKQEIANQEKHFPCPSNLEDVWQDMLANPNTSSRKPVFARFDQLVGGRTLLHSGSDSAVLRTHLKKDAKYPKQALAITMTSNALYVKSEPYLGTVQSIAEGMRNLAAVGAEPIGLACCFNFGSAERYREVCDLSESIRGMGDASRIWNLPIMSQEVSLENGTEGSPTVPTPTVVTIGTIADYANLIPPYFKTKGDKIFLLGESKNEIGCTEYTHYIHKRVNSLVPDIDFQNEADRCKQIRELINLRILSSCHDLGRGGLAIALVESCLLGTKPIGAKLNLTQCNVPSEEGAPLRKDAALFGETSARFLVSCSPENEDSLLNFCDTHHIPISASGEVGGKNIEVYGHVEVELPLSTTYKLWVHRLELYLRGGLQSQSTSQLVNS